MMDLGSHLLTNLCTYASALSSFEVSIRMLMNSAYQKCKFTITIHAGTQHRMRIHIMKVVKQYLVN